MPPFNPDVIVAVVHGSTIDTAKLSLQLMDLCAGAQIMLTNSTFDFGTRPVPKSTASELAQLFKKHFPLAALVVGVDQRSVVVLAKGQQENTQFLDSDQDPLGAVAMAIAGSYCPAQTKAPQILH